jgi:hypothetical protein
MPGAFYFEDGDLIVVAGDRCRADESAPCVEPPLAVRRREEVTTPLMMAAPTAPPATRRQRPTGPAKRPPRRPDTSAPSAEDH